MIAACRTACLVIGFGIVVASASAADLNRRNRLDDGNLGMPIDRMFKAKPPVSPYETEGANGERGFLPPIIQFTPPPPSHPANSDRRAPPETGATKAPAPKPSR